MTHHIVMRLACLFVLVASACSFAAVHPAPELDDIDFEPPTHAVPDGAFRVSPDGEADVLSTDAEQPGSLEYTLSNAPQGATVVLKGGTYRIAHSLRRQLHVQNAPGERVVIKASDVVDAWTPAGDGLWYTPWDTKLTGNEPRTTDPKYPESFDFDQVYRDGRSLHQTRDDPTTPEVEGREDNAFGPGRFFLGTVDGQQRVYVADDPTGAVMEVSRRNNNFNFGPGSEGSVLRGIVFAHGGSNNMTVSTHDVTLEDNLFAWSANFGLGVYGGNVVIRNNKFISNGHNGVSGHFGNLGRGGLVEGNYFAHNNAEGFSLRWNSAAFKAIFAKNLKLYNNIVEDNYTNGLWVDVHVNHVEMVGNVVRNNSGTGLFFESSHDAVVAFNIVTGNLWNGLLVADASQAQVWHNTFVGNGKGVTIKDGRRFNAHMMERGGPGSPINFNAQEIANGSWEITRGCVVKNNIISASRQFQFDFGEEVFAPVQDPSPRVRLADGTIRWDDDAIPQGTFMPIDGVRLLNPHPLQHLGSRSMFYVSDGTTGRWSERAGAVDANLFHASPEASDTTRGTIRWMPEPGNRVVYDLSAFAEETDQGPRQASLGGDSSPFVDAASGDFRLTRDAANTLDAEPLPEVVRRAAMAAGVALVLDDAPLVVGAAGVERD